MRLAERGILLLLALIVIFDHVRPARAGGDRSVSASEFSLVTDVGTSVGSFRISAEGMPELILGDGKGHGRIVIAVRKDTEAVVGLTDSKGNVRIGLVSSAEGESKLQLTDAANTPRIAMTLATEGGPRLSLRSAGGRALVGLAVDEKDAPSLSISSAKGDAHLDFRAAGGVFGLYLGDTSEFARAGIELDPTGVAQVFAQDAGGRARAALVAPADSPPSLSMKDAAGKKIPPR